MTDDTLPLSDALPKRGGGDFLKGLAEEVLGRLMACDVEGRIGAGEFWTAPPNGVRRPCTSATPGPSRCVKGWRATHRRRRESDRPRRNPDAAAHRPSRDHGHGRRRAVDGDVRPPSRQSRNLVIPIGPAGAAPIISRNSDSLTQRLARAPMFVEGGGGWRPPPWQPPPRRPRMTRKQERVLLWLVGVNVLFLLIAPIGGVTIVQTMISLLVHG